MKNRRALGKILCIQQNSQTHKCSLSLSCYVSFLPHHTVAIFLRRLGLAIEAAVRLGAQLGTAATATTSATGAPLGPASAAAMAGAAGGRGAGAGGGAAVGGGGGGRGSGWAGRRQIVHSLLLVKGKPFYGYCAQERLYIKIQL